MKFDADRLGKLAGFRSARRGTLNEASNQSYHDGDANDDADWRWGKNQLSEKDQPSGGNKGDESKSKRDYEVSEADDDIDLDGAIAEGEYGGNKGDESKSRRDYTERQDYGGNKGDESRSKRDYSEADDEVVPMDERQKSGGNKGDESRSRRDYEADEGYGADRLSKTHTRGTGEEEDPELDYSGDHLGELEDPDWKGESDIILDLDENMLRREISRMRQERIARLNETKLRSAIRNEIKGIFSELDIHNRGSKWVYGADQPKNSAAGYINMAFPGIGFK
jgi:hypothetical protein